MRQKCSLIPVVNAKWRRTSGVRVVTLYFAKITEGIEEDEFVSLLLGEVTAGADQGGWGGGGKVTWVTNFDVPLIVVTKLSPPPQNPGYAPVRPSCLAYDATHLRDGKEPFTITKFWEDIRQACVPDNGSLSWWRNQYRGVDRIFQREGHTVSNRG